jgi:hypothetical protein
LGPLVEPGAIFPTVAQVLAGGYPGANTTSSCTLTVMLSTPWCQGKRAMGACVMLRLGAGTFSIPCFSLSKQVDVVPNGKLGQESGGNAMGILWMRRCASGVPLPPLGHGQVSRLIGAARRAVAVAL